MSVFQNLTPMNPNREVFMYFAGGRTASNDRTWRTFASTKFASRESSNVDTTFDVPGNVVLTLDSENISFTPNMTFGPAFSQMLQNLPGLSRDVGNISSLVSAFQGLTGGSDIGAFSPWIKNTQTFVDAGPFTVELQFSFKIGKYGLWDAREEVLKPLVNLLAIAIPEEMNDFRVVGPTPPSSYLIGRLLRDMSFQNAAENVARIGEGGIREFLGNLAEQAYNSITGTDNASIVTLEFGPSDNRILKLADLYVTRAVPTYSTKVDQFGIPIQASISMSFQSLKPIVGVDNTTSGAGRKSIFLPGLLRERTGG